MTQKNKLVVPTRTLILEKIAEFYDKSNSVGLHEDAIRKLFTTFHKNTDYSEVFLKVTVLDKFYSTRIPSIVKYARAICEIEGLDRMLKTGDLKAVGLISTILKKYNQDHPEENKRPKKAENSRYISFASKYCSHHDVSGNHFPIFDSIASNLLYQYNLQEEKKLYPYERMVLICGESRGREWKCLTKKKLNNIFLYKDLLIAFRDYYNLQEFKLKELDIFLWMYGKELKKK